MREPNFTFLTPTLAVGGSVPHPMIERIARSFRIRAVIDLRIEACDDRSILARHGLSFLHLPTEDHAAVSQAMLDEGVGFANQHLDRNERVLVHCEHGIGRSATLALCIRVSRGEEPLAALERSKDARPLVSPSPAQYEAWVEWLARWRESHRAAWTIPDFDTFKRIAYRHLTGAA